MDYFIKKNNGKEHYFYLDGLCMEKDGHRENISREAKPVFCVFESDEVVHVLFINQKNELVYIPKKDRENKEYVLCDIKDDLDVRNIKITKSKERLNLLYSAKYREEFLLIHCVLGNQAKPSVIDKISEEYFFPYRDRVYYANKSGFMGFQEMSDGKPDRFVTLAEEAVMPYLCKFKEREYLIYKKGEDICINHIPKISDKFALYPVLKQDKGKAEIVWQSGGVLKYTELENPGSQKRIISSRVPVLHSFQDGENIFFAYDVGEKEDTSDLVQEIERLRKEINMLERRIKNFF